MTSNTWHTKKSVWITATAILAGALIAGGMILGDSLTRAHRTEVFIDALRSDPRSHVDSLPDEQLAVGLDESCDRIAAGLTVEQQLTSARRNVEAGLLASSPLTEFEYYENVQAIYDASVRACNG